MIRLTDLSDDDLLRRMMAGEEEAFLALYRRRQACIYRFALQMSGNPAIAEDVTQEVFMTLIREPQRYDPSRGSLSAFLYGIARNRMLQRIERDRLLVPLPEEAGANGALSKGDGSGLFGDDFARDLARAETVKQVRRAVLALPASYREVVVLCDLQEMSYEETATALGCAVGTVRSRLHRARTLLMLKLRGVTQPQKKPPASASGLQRGKAHELPGI